MINKEFYDQSSVNKPKTPPKYAFIDALRGLAILGVLVYHASFRIPGLDERTAALSRSGHHGVQLFFIVSALTLFLSLGTRRSQEAHPIRNFFIRRFFRIAPLFYLGALFYYEYDRLARAGLGSAGSSLGCILATLTFTNGWNVDWINRLVPGGWSIAVEMNFYLLVPWLFRRIRNARQAAAAAFLALLGGGLASSLTKFLLTRSLGAGAAEGISRFTWYWLPAQATIFLTGILLYFLVRPLLDGREDRERVPQPSPWLLLAIAVYLVVALSFSEPTLYLGHGLFAVAAALLAWSQAIRPLPLIVNPFTRALGVLSFSAYLSHFAVLDLTESLFRILPGIFSTSLPPLPRLVVFIAVALAGTMVVSALTYRAIELPAQALGRRLIRHLESRQPAEAVAVEAC